MDGTSVESGVGPGGEARTAAWEFGLHLVTEGMGPRVASDLHSCLGWCRA